MRPLAYHNDHLCWQQRVSKERCVLKDFYKCPLRRTFGGLTIPAEHRTTFREFFPIRKPQGFRNVSPDWLESFRLQRAKPENLGGTILGGRSKEVRGKYSRPVEALNGLVRLKTTDDVQKNKIDLHAKTTGFVHRETARKEEAPHGSDSPMSPVKPLSASVSPRKLPKDYIDRLKAQLESERQRRTEVEERISRIQSSGKA